MEAITSYFWKDLTEQCTKYNLPHAANFFFCMQQVFSLTMQNNSDILKIWHHFIFHYVRMKRDQILLITTLEKFVLLAYL